MNSQLHYEIWFRVWWETIQIELKDETKEFTIPYRLYMCIECDLNTAVTACYQSVFGTKTKYSDLAAIGFENEAIIQELISDITFVLIFLHVRNLHVVIPSIEIKKNQYTLEIYLESQRINKIVEEALNKIWDQ
ncbi:3094_t:CDS:2, partial [Racocetra persica]